MINAIFGAVTQVVTAFAQSISQAVTSVASMFITNTEGTFELTMLGSLLLIAVGAGLVFWAFRLIKGLVKRA